MTVHFDRRLSKWRFDFYRAKIRYQDWCLNLDGSECRNKTEALKAQERAAAKVQTSARLPKVTTGAHNLAGAMTVFADHLSPGRHRDNQRVYVVELLKWFGAEQSLLEIEGRVAQYIAWARKQPVRVWRGGSDKKAETKKREPWADAARTRSDATINRYLDALRRAIRLYGSLPDPLTDAPRLPRMPKIPKLKEAKRIPRPVSDGDLERIIAEAAPWVVDAAVLARNMGFRRTEMLALALGQVDIEQRCVWLEAEGTKGNRDEKVPANATALEILSRRKAEAEALGIDTLFWYVPPSKKNEPAKKPQPVRSIKRAWRSAQKRAGLSHLYRFHDLKAAFVTSIAQHAAPQDVQKLARHKDFDTTRAYLEVSSDRGRAAVDAMDKAVREKVRERRVGSGKIQPLSARRAAVKSIT